MKVEVGILLATLLTTNAMRQLQWFEKAGLEETPADIAAQIAYNFTRSEQVTWLTIRVTEFDVYFQVGVRDGERLKVNVLITEGHLLWSSSHLIYGLGFHVRQGDSTMGLPIWMENQIRPTLAQLKVMMEPMFPKPVRGGLEEPSPVEVGA